MRSLALMMVMVAGSAAADDSDFEAAVGRLSTEVLQDVAKHDSVKNWSSFWSWYLCDMCNELVAEGERTIKHERAKAKVAGVQNTAAIYAAQENVVAGRGCKKAVDKFFVKHKVAALKCSSTGVATVRECMALEEDSSDGRCRLWQLIWETKAPPREHWFEAD